MPPAPLLPFLCQAVWAPHSLGNTGLMGTAQLGPCELLSTWCQDKEWFGG